MSNQASPEEYGPVDPANGAWAMLASMLPVADLTAMARSGKSHAFVEDISKSSGVFDLIARTLSRGFTNHVLITGLKGVGKTTIVREIADRAANHKYPSLSQYHFLWVDCTNIGPEDSRGCLETVLTAAQGGKTVLCLEGFDRLLIRPHGASNKPLIRAAVARPDIRVIGIISRSAFYEHIASDADMLELFTRIEIEEPSEEYSLEIARQHANELQRRFSVEIRQSIVDRASILASNYVLSERHPSKTIRLLERACEDARFDRDQFGISRTTISEDDIVRVIADKTGIPVDTITGNSDETDFESALEEAVVGQVHAIQAVAGELQLIKAGLTEPNKPATVLLFAGMTGVGKTELAKRIAELYSTSKRLQTYAMGNYTEPHSVSGIIGVPPGYVGHDQGGRLVNELNADPYAVFLLDEAEKAHPNVWKPFLNLFDEGWITDQRGLKAYADRAIFILTTNAGDNTIAQMTKQGKSESEIIDRVKQTLSRIRIERSTQPVFTPQFLARIGKIIVFRTLDEEAMIGITRKHVKRMCDQWLQKRQKTVHVDSELVTAIGQHCHESNQVANGQEGGRIVRRTIADVIEREMQKESIRLRDQYDRCQTINVSIESLDPSELKATVQFEASKDSSKHLS